MPRATINTLFTIGYEGLDLNQFILKLKDNNVKGIIDVRDVPLSRKKGFSKTKLKARLEEEGLKYVHVRELGSPKEIRKKLKEDKDYDYFFKEFSKYLAEKNDTLLEISEYLFDKIYCLMCFEQSAEKCHRSLVAENIVNLQNNRFQVVHI